MTLTVNLEPTAKNAIRGAERGDAVVVIDVLRCTSTIVNALANGALSIIPVETVKHALELRRSHKEYILAGERRGLKPHDFDLGNSPIEFTPERIAGKEIVLTTTSGTKALNRSKRARRVLVGAFLNGRAVAETSLQIAREERIGITLALAGTKGGFSLEDFLCAGAIIKDFVKENARLSDASYAAFLSFQQVQEHLYENILKGTHAQFLVGLGLENDVEFCCKLNYCRIVPFYEDGVVTLLPE